MAMNIIAGIFFRRTIRKWLQSTGVYFHEDKRFLDSLFVVVAEPTMLRALQKRLDDAGILSS